MHLSVFGLLVDTFWYAKLMPCRCRTLLFQMTSVSHRTLISDSDAGSFNQDRFLHSPASHATRIAFFSAMFLSPHRHLMRSLTKDGKHACLPGRPRTPSNRKEEQWEKISMSKQSGGGANSSRPFANTVPQPPFGATKPSAAMEASKSAGSIQIGILGISEFFRNCFA
jgi:hypothetical protein